MKRLFSIFGIMTFVVSCPMAVFAIDCDLWIKHLSNAHQVFIINDGGVRNTAFDYTKIPNTPYVVAIRKDQAKEWVLDVKSVGSNGAFVVRNTIFGYTGEFATNGKCANSTEFRYDGNSGNKSSADANFRGSLSSKKVTPIYNWAVCEKIKTLLTKNKMWQVDADIARLKLLSVNDYNYLKRLCREAMTSTLYQTEPPGADAVSSFVTNCEGKEKYLEEQKKFYPRTLDMIYQKNTSK